MEIPYWMGLQQQATCSNAHENNEWIIVSRSRDGSFILAQNMKEGTLGIWVLRAIAISKNIVPVDGGEGASLWFRIGAIEDRWLLSMKGVIGAQFDSCILSETGLNLGISVLLEQMDLKLAVFRVDVSCVREAVCLSPRWEVHPMATVSLETESLIHCLLSKINAHANEIGAFVKQTGTLIHLFNPYRYPRMDFSWVEKSSCKIRDSGLSSCSSTTFSSPSSLRMTPSSSLSSPLSVQNGGNNDDDDTSLFLDCLDLLDSNLSEQQVGGQSKKRAVSASEVESMCTGNSKRGRRPGSKDSKPRVRGPNLPRTALIEGLVSVLKLLMFFDTSGGDPSVNKKPNHKVTCMFTLTRPFKNWYMNKSSLLLNRRMAEMMSLLGPALMANRPFLLKDFSAEFCDSIKDPRIMDLYNECRSQMIWWARNGCLCDFFEDGLIEGSDAGSSGWLLENETALMHMGVLRVRSIHIKEREKRQQYSLAEPLPLPIDADFSSLGKLQERLASEQDIVMNHMRMEWEAQPAQNSVEVDDRVNRERLLRHTYGTMESSINKAVAILRESEEIALRMKSLEKSKQELCEVFRATAVQCAGFTRGYIPHASSYSDVDVGNAIGEIFQRSCDKIYYARGGSN